MNNTVRRNMERLIIDDVGDTKITARLVIHSKELQGLIGDGYLVSYKKNAAGTKTFKPRVDIEGDRIEVHLHKPC